MKTRFTYHIGLLVVTSIFMVDCGKKYPKDPFLTPRSSKKRLEKNLDHAYQWNIDRVLINGEDVTSKYNDSLIPNSLNDISFRFDFDFDSGGFETEYNLVYLNFHGSSKTTDADIAVWRIGLDPKSEDFSFSGNTGTTFFNVNDTLIHTKLFNLLSFSWKIRKLYKRNFQLRTTKNGVEHEVHFKRL